MVPYMVMPLPLPDDADGAPAHPAQMTIQLARAINKSLFIRVSLLLAKASILAFASDATCLAHTHRRFTSR
jgi:hypothetical protein